MRILYRSPVLFVDDTNSCKKSSGCGRGTADNHNNRHTTLMNGRGFRWITDSLSGLFKVDIPPRNRNNLAVGSWREASPVARTGKTRPLPTKQEGKRQTPAQLPSKRFIVHHVQIERPLVRRKTLCTGRQQLAIPNMLFDGRRVEVGRRISQPHAQKMILRTLCLFFFWYIVSSLDDCEVYVDSQSGNDVSSCGSKMHPCRSIPYNSSNVCLSSGQYNVTDRLPSEMRGWWPVGTEGEKPQITCLETAEISCSAELLLNWNRVDVNRCIVYKAPTFSEVSLQSVGLFKSQLTISTKDASPNSTINGCVLNGTTLNLHHASSQESPSTTVTSPSFFRFTSNLLESSIFSFDDATTGIQSYQEVINNTYEMHSNDEDTGSISIMWSGAYDGQNDTGRHLIVQNNIIASISFSLASSGLPDVHLLDNIIIDCKMEIYPPVTDDGSDRSSSLRVENNTFWFLQLNKEGTSAGGLIMRHNIVMQNIRIESDGLPLLMQSNDIHRCWILQTKGNEHRAGDIITDNRFSLLDYKVTSVGMDTPTRIDRNHMSTTHIAMNSPDSTICMVNNTWTGSTVTEDEPDSPALHIFQIYDSFFYLESGSIDGYTGEGIKIGSAIDSIIGIESVTISNCRMGGISMNSEQSSLELKSITFYNNTSPAVGGAISVSGHAQTIVVKDCNLIDNHSPHSSAVSISGGYIQMTNVNIVVQDDIENPFNDHSVVNLNGRYRYENVSLSCAEERYLASSNSTSSLAWSCRPCTTGTYFLGRGEVVEDIERGNMCLICPEKGVECVDGKTPKAKPNYWCGENTSQELICHNCPSGYCNQIGHPWNSSCIGHRSGDLCGGCVDGYTLGFLTSSCLSIDGCRHGWIGLLSVIPFVYVSVLLFLPIGDGSVWKSMSYFVQTVPLLLKQERQNSVMTMFSSLFSTPTNMGSSSWLGFCIGQMDYVQREFMSLYVPFGTVFLFLFLCLSATLYHKMGCTMEPRRNIKFLTKALDNRSILRRCTTGLVTAVLLMYSGLIASYLKLYFCIEIEPTRWVMYNAGTETCDQPWRTVLVCVSSILLLPLPLVLLFIRRRLKGTERETGRDVLMVLDGCYRDSRKYWESIYMVRRLAIAVAYVFITDERWSATVMRLLLLTALFLHLFFAPFITAAGQTLETICLLSLSCLTVLNGQLEERYSHAFLVIIASPFLASLVIAIHKFWMKRKKKDDVRQLERVFYTSAVFTSTLQCFGEDVIDAPSFVTIVALTTSDCADRSLHHGLVRTPNTLSFVCMVGSKYMWIPLKRIMHGLVSASRDIYECSGSISAFADHNPQTRRRMTTHRVLESLDIQDLILQFLFHFDPNRVYPIYPAHCQCGIEYESIRLTREDLRFRMEQKQREEQKRSVESVDELRAWKAVRLSSRRLRQVADKMYSFETVHFVDAVLKNNLPAFKFFMTRPEIQVQEGLMFASWKGNIEMLGLLVGDERVVVKRSKSSNFDVFGVSSSEEADLVLESAPDRQFHEGGFSCRDTRVEREKILRDWVEHLRSRMEITYSRLCEPRCFASPDPAKNCELNTNMEIPILVPLEVTENGSFPEWISLELQGNIEPNPSEVLKDLAKDASVCLGKLRVEKSVTLEIGNHSLEGKVVTLPKPLLVTQRTEWRRYKSEIIPDDASLLIINTQIEYHITGVIRKKFLFSTRPHLMISEQYKKSPIKSPIKSP
ncbi:hypothetical protein PROFUN_09075 [Planoprotostelium fungivorum]|uniref:Right handed beta helix domain-containing protein n=1 Tax=Planoprotostelium fungivorum TaxID=1890364 RepID=A0A2P6NIF4_9EUKA|nr:hypothetical protein PROFUN_09075 [Planoprotostelium fungivorum]